MAKNQLLNNNEDCFTDPHTGKTTCVKTMIAPQKTVLEIHGPHEHIEQLHDVIVSHLNRTVARNER
jgi:hypothetical protein